MTQTLLLDTGPLVAYLSANDQHHKWAIDLLEGADLPLLSCEAVIAEAYFLLRRDHVSSDALMRLVDEGVIQIAFDLNDEVRAIREFMRRYRSVPMSLADACLVRMSELYRNAKLATLDSDFLIYRRDRNDMIPIVMP